ncbi:RNA polymerase B [Friedmanniomyces endolithicus]|nr:RNA polymerase B [Friedmanniomyces endolithicus]KAK0809784.1 RNA polymerase B [Friedmanniomyces endolithicus]KAK0820447.1 RNA polymerase B [Friedmanniomyces endolithicus]KAK0862048.1 RNA polymerase B [Friedmanniomyces endolithicus]KAK0881185.1 RNA polymerase B [Friedmanniomyces endolithicus]
MAGPTQTRPPTLSRARPPPTGDEEATTVLRLGDMDNTPCLSVAECHELLSRLAEKDSDGDNKRAGSSSDVYLKTREYVGMFARFKDSKTVTQVDAISSALLGKGAGGGVTAFERAQLATLCCDTAEEARTLIPSLEGKLDDEALQSVLDDISKLRDFS